MQPSVRVGVTVLLTAASATVAAQRPTGYSTAGSRLSPSVATAYYVASAGDGPTQSRWFKFIVLWRGQSDWGSALGEVDTTALRLADAQYRAASKAAFVADELFVGGQAAGVAFTATVDSARRTLTVLGRRFPIPGGDSALIVMVDRVDRVGGDPVIAGTAVVEARLPDVPAQRTWTHGDTTFILHPREDPERNLKTILDQDSTVAAFWRAPRSPGGLTDVLIESSPRTVRSISLDDFQPDLPSVDGSFECTGREAIGQTSMGRQIVGADAVAYSAAFPSKADTRATAVVMVDSAGKIIRYAERRGPPLAPAPAGPDPRANAEALTRAVSAVRGTTITLDYRAGRGNVANRGGGKPDQMISGPIDIIGLMEKFGKPMDRATRVLAQCSTGGPHSAVEPF